MQVLAAQVALAVTTRQLFEKERTANRMVIFNLGNISYFRMCVVFISKIYYSNSSFLLSFFQNNALCDLSKQIVAQATLEPTLHLIMNMAHDLFEADIVSLFLIDRETHMMHKVNTQIGVEVIRISMAKGIFEILIFGYSIVKKYFPNLK